MTNVVLFSMSYPELRVIGTNDITNFKSWYYSNTLDRYNIEKIKHVTGDVFLAVVTKGTRGSLWITYNQGYKFEKVMDLDGTPYALERGRDGAMFFAVGSSTYRSIDGKNWSLLAGAPPNIKAFACCNNGLLFAHDGEKVWKTINNGLDWSQVYSRHSYGHGGSNSYAIAANASGSKLLISSGSSLMFSSTYGNSWSSKAVWDNWYIPQELRYIIGSRWILKIKRTSEELHSIQLTTDDGQIWKPKFNQYGTHTHQIEYVESLSLLVIGHSQFTDGGICCPCTTPSIMVSRNYGDSFTEYLITDEKRCTEILGITGAATDYKGAFSMDMLLKGTRTKGFNASLTLKGNPIRSIDADVVLQKTRVAPVDMNIFSRKRNSVDLRIEALLNKTITSDLSMDMHLVQRGFATYQSNMLIQNDKKTVIDIDAFFRKNITKGYGMRLFITDSHFDAIKTEMARSVPQAFNIESPPICHKLLADIQVNRSGETNE